MAFSAKKIELIEKYYNEKLSSEELAFFNQQLVKDSLFAEEVKQYEFIFKGIDRARSNQLKREFEEIESSIKSSNFKLGSLKSIVKKYSTAALVSVVLIVGVYITSISNFDIKNQLLYVEYFKPYPNVLAPTMRSVSHENTAIYTAMKKYDSMHYNQAISAFDVLLKDTDHKNEIQFYKAVSLMSEGLHEEAKKLLKEMDASGSFKNQRKWYLALTLLQLNELEETEVLLKEIDRSYNSFSNAAGELLEAFFSK